MNIKVEKIESKDKAKVTVAKATIAGEFNIKDKSGRTIVMKRPSSRADIYFPTLFTRDEAANPSFMMEVKLYAFVKEIEGKPVGSLDKKSDLDVLIDILGYEGRKALQLGYAKNFAKEDMKEQEEINEEIKKLL